MEKTKIVNSLPVLNGNNPINMNTRRYTMIRFLVIVAILIFTSSISLAMPSVGTTDVYFSPKGGATEAIVKEIIAAKQEILVQAYGFTSKPIAKAILDAKKRGIGVIAILDKSNIKKDKNKAQYTAATFLQNAGCMVLVDDSHPIAHNKVIIIDRSTLITGSFNFTAAAEKNAENLLIIKDNKQLVDKYFYNFDAHKNHSERYKTVPNKEE